MIFYTRRGLSVRPPDVAKVSSVTTQRDASGSHQHDATQGAGLPRAYFLIVQCWDDANGDHFQVLVWGGQYVQNLREGFGSIYTSEFWGFMAVMFQVEVFLGCDAV
jgi:hypothetical protein